MKDSKIRPKVDIPVFAVCLIINIVMFVYCAVRWDSIPRYAFSLRPGTKIVFQIGLIEIPVVLLLLIFVHAIGVLFPSLGFYPGIRITESNRIPIQNCIRNMGDISLGFSPSSRAYCSSSKQPKRSFPLQCSGSPDCFSLRTWFSGTFACTKSRKQANRRTLQEFP